MLVGPDYLLRFSEHWKGRRIPLCGIIYCSTFKASRDSWRSLEGSETLTVCMCLGGHKPWSHTGCRLPLKLFSVTAYNSGLNSAAERMNCSSHQHRTHLGQTPRSVLWGQYICRITYPSLCKRNALFPKTFFSLSPQKFYSLAEMAYQCL